MIDCDTNFDDVSVCCCVLRRRHARAHPRANRGAFLQFSVQESVRNKKKKRMWIIKFPLFAVNR